MLPLVVVDSLNMFSMHSPKREEIYRLFDLFRQYRTTGLFVVESSEGVPFDSTMADVVIGLTMTEDKEYFTRHIEVQKSRYRNQVYGRHPFKTVPLQHGAITLPICDKHKENEQDEWDPMRHGVVAAPSLHYVVLRSSEMLPEGLRTGTQPGRWQNPGETWGIEAMSRILPRNLVAEVQSLLKVREVHSRLTWP